MTTEAQKAAKKRYKERIKAEGKYKSLLIEFYQSDMDIYEYLNTKKPTATYIKDLIRKDMEKQDIEME